jgi:hypothetical protein
MKIRIKGNSIRIRLSKPEVAQLAETGFVSDRTAFANSHFSYEIRSEEGTGMLCADYKNNTITMRVPAAFVNGWEHNDITGLDATMPISDSETLYLLLEKDFKCVDKLAEDQSEYYDHPSKIC